MARGTKAEGAISVARPIGVFVMDENTIFREGLRTVIDQDGGLRVVGHRAELSEDLASDIAAERPDVVLLGLERVTERTESIVAEVLRASPGTDTIVLGWDVAQGTLERLMELGVRAYLPKDVPHRYLLSIIYVSRFDDRRMAFSWPRDGGRGHGGRALAPVPAEVPGENVPLSDREREVVVLVGKAMTNAQIGRQLGISEGTVKRHLHNIFVKLHAVSRLDAVNKAVALSMIMLQ